MTAPLLSVGGIGLATMALNGLRQLQPGQFLRELWSGDSSATGSALLDAPRSRFGVSESLDLNEALPALVDELRKRFSAAGIDLSQPIVLKDDGDGGVIIDGDHADRATIEYLMAASPNLRHQFQAVMQAATEKHDKLAPWLGQSLGEFRLELDEDSSAVRFE